MRLRAVRIWSRQTLIVSRFAGVFAVLVCMGTIFSVTGIPSTATEAFGQTPAQPPKPQQKAKPAEPDAAFSTTIGASGFSVPIPEIKMQSIIGERRAPKTPPPSQPPQEVEQTPSKPVSPPAEAEEPAPPKELSTPESSPPEPPAEPAAPVETAPAERLPFEPRERAPGTRETAPVPPATQPAPPALTEPTEDDASSRFVGVPETPEEVFEAPAPVREVLQPKPAPKVPDLLDGQTVKGTVPAAPVQAVDIQDVPTEEWIPLDSRREIEPIAPPAPVSEAQPSPPAEAQPQPRPEVSPPAVPQHAQPPEPVPLAPPTSEAEQHEEELPPVEPEPERPLPEIISSPLEESALDSREVREYLTASVPVLEELSLLMTRVPALDVADFDPSETDPAAASTDLLMKMDSLKRELQVLDSKTFSIIPPSKYVLFHSLIRESITQTYQACESMIAFMQNRKEDDLKSVREHIFKARQLLSRTRNSTG